MKHSLVSFSFARLLRTIDVGIFVTDDEKVWGIHCFASSQAGDQA